MILYTLAPLAEQLCQPETLLQDPLPSVTCSLSGGYLQGVVTPHGLRVTRIDSTDPTVYLKCENDIGFLRTDLHPPLP